MSVRFDASADQLSRSAGLIDYNGVYTVAFWAYLSTDLNATSSICVFDDGTANNRDSLRTSGDGTTLQSRVDRAGVGGSASGTNMTVATWYHIAGVRESTTSLKLYLNGVLDSTNTADVTGRAADTAMVLGKASTGTRFDGRLAAVKIWSTNLTQAEVAQEMNTIRPVRTANLYGFWPIFPGSGERVRDYSGNGRDWTEGGTPTDEDPPPVAWGAASIWPPFTPVVVAPPAAVGPYVGDLAIYDTLGATGSISGATLFAGDAYDSLTATGSIAGATLPSGDTIYDNLGATGTATGATLLPSENV